MMSPSFCVICQAVFDNMIGTGDCMNINISDTNLAETGDLSNVIMLNTYSSKYDHDPESKGDIDVINVYPMQP